MIKEIKKDLRWAADGEKAKLLRRFFKTGKGEYGEGDRFLGVMVPQQRLIVRKYWRDVSVVEAEELLKSRYHEERLTALLILAAKFKMADEAGKKEIFNIYLANTKFINNWDLVDLSAPNIVGAYLEGKDSSVLFNLAKSKSLWERRISILATFYFIKNCETKIALEVAQILLNDKHDLIHKAVGWMLREIEKRCAQEIEEAFLKKYYKTMPRTMLRYAIERFNEKKRRYYLG